MNLELYHKLIENPGLLNKDSLKDVENLVERFPMVENFRILLALNLLILNDYRYKTALTHAAIYSSDRRKLKKWVDYILHTMNEPAEEFIQEPVNVTHDILTTEETADPEIQEEESVEKISQEEIPAGPELKAEPKEDIEEEKQNLEAEKKAIRSKKELLKLVQKRLAEIEAEKALRDADGNDPDDKKMKAKLIDRFIEQEPSISRPDKNEFYNPEVEAVESSIVDDDFFVTETLAQIHTQQGNLKKAEEIYRKLILKNPEKSIYFAAQIEKLTKK